MTILVTGGAGFIGSHLCEALLRRGDRVVALDNFDPFYDPRIKERNLSECLIQEQFTLVRGDILDADAVERVFAQWKFDLVIHLAAKAGVRPSIIDPLAYAKVNIQGTMSILESMRRHGVKKLILASSSSVYGNNAKVPYSETDNVDHAISPYAASKKACEVLAYTYYHLYAIECYCLRFFTVYGPRQRPEMAIHAFTRAIKENQPITVFGDGSSQRDYTYIDDIVSGLLACVDRMKGFEILNLGESATTSLSDLVRLIERVIGRQAQIDRRPVQPGDVQHTFADISKARRILGYNPQVPIQVGLGRFVSWYTTTKQQG